MDDLSSARIDEDVIIFSQRRVNAFNATIKKGATIVLGGTPEVLQSVLSHRAELLSNHKAAMTSKTGALDISQNPILSTEAEST